MENQIALNKSSIRGRASISKSAFTNEYFENYESPFLGILEGKQRKAKAEAFIKEEEARRATYLAQVEAQKQGYDPEKATRDTKIVETQAAINSEKILYAAIGLIVVVVMVGLYFIKRK